jgi:hypothetical protein
MIVARRISDIPCLLSPSTKTQLELLDTQRPSRAGFTQRRRWGRTPAVPRLSPQAKSQGVLRESVADAIASTSAEITQRRPRSAILNPVDGMIAHVIARWDIDEARAAGEERG